MRCSRNSPPTWRAITARPSSASWRSKCTATRTRAYEIFVANLKRWVAGEPLFQDIVKRAKQLKTETEAYRQALAKADPNGVFASDMARRLELL